LKVKICGNTSLDDASMAISSGADGLGFLIGLRYATDDEIKIPRAAEIIAATPPLIAYVLVTHRGEVEWVIETARTIGANTLQLHGDFDIHDVPRLRRELPGIKLIKAVHVRGPESIDEAAETAKSYDAILIDTETATRIGGTGQTHDWAISARIVESTSSPVILAGGLTPENVSEAILTVKPYAVDVNSGVEYPNGKKSPQRLRAFISRAHHAFEELTARRVDVHRVAQ
jgi:phosphoribosylanthranilate isomerase